MRGEHLTSQLSWVTAWLLVTRVSPIHLVDELVFVFYASLYDWAKWFCCRFFWDGEYGFSTVGVGVIPGNGCRIQEQMYIASLQGSKVTAGFHYKDWILGI